MPAPEKLSVVLPTFEERENICRLVEEVLAVGASVCPDIEVLIVDDNSPDGTAEAVQRRFGGDERVRLIVRTQDRGLAKSIRAGLETATGDILLVMDTDFNHPPKDVATLYLFAQRADLVVGSRFILGGGMPNRTRYLLSYLYNIFMRWTIGTKIDDNLSGFFSIRREALEQIDFDKVFWGYGDYFFRLLLLSQRAGLRHVQVPVFYGERPGGHSKTRALSVLIQYTREVVKLLVLKLRGRW